MRPSELNKNSPGTLVEIAGGIHAFVPHLMPPKFSRSTAVNRAAEEAVNAIGELRGMSTGGASFIGTDNFIRPLLRREAVLSSKIEGTVATVRDLLAFEASPKQKNLPDDVQEVRSYHKAVSDGLFAIQQNPVITLHLIRSLHQNLMHGVRGGEATPGKFRMGQVFIGPPMSKDMREAHFVPPPAHEVEPLLRNLVDYVNSSQQSPQLEIIAVAHYQFETIHPFLDGNGRIGRLLITLALAAMGLLPKPMLHLSAFFERNKQEYYDRLLAVSQHGDWQGWLNYFFQGVKSEAEDAKRRIHDAANLRDNLLRRLDTKHKQLSIAAQLLLDEIFRNPMFSIAAAADAIKRSIPTTQKLVNLFVDEGILQAPAQARRNRIYVAEDILKLYES